MNSILKSIVSVLIKWFGPVLTWLAYGFEKKVMIKSIYDITEKDGLGNEVKMSDFKGYVLCIVNVASK